MLLPFPSKIEKEGWPWVKGDHVSYEVSDGKIGLPKISIVTPSLNQGQFLEETIRSVLLQGYPNLEYIVIDGGSTDDSVDIIKRYEPWLSYWVSEPDSGQSEAINKGFAKATGDWFGWLNSDDLYLPNTFRELIYTVNSKEGSQWVVGTTVRVDQDGIEQSRFSPSFRAETWIDVVCMRNAVGMALPQPSSFWSRYAWQEAGPLDLSLNFAMDYALWCELAWNGHRPLLVHSDWALFRQHQEAKTSGEGLNFLQEEQLIVARWLKKTPHFQLTCYNEMLLKKIAKAKREFYVRKLKATIKRLVRM